jgi:hypothetical protein
METNQYQLRTKKDQLSAQSVVRNMYRLSVRHNVKNIHHLIEMFELDTFVDRNIENWTIESQQEPTFEPLNLN